jgi:hypothetical protein
MYVCMYVFMYLYTICIQYMYVCAYSTCTLNAHKLGTVLLLRIAAAASFVQTHKLRASLSIENHRIQYISFSNQLRMLLALEREL